MGTDDWVRVRLGRVGERLVATPLPRGAGVLTSLVRADGLVVVPARSRDTTPAMEVDVRLLRGVGEIERTIVATGSHDLVLDLAASELRARDPRIALASSNVGSLGGLTALRDGLCHLAGSHLLDPDTGEYTLPWIERLLPDRDVAVVRLTHRDQGLIVAPGNPLGLAGIEDLVRPGLRYVNRQRGAGTRVLLDHELATRGIEPDAVEGYAREEHTHLAVAAAVAAGRADCGLGVMAAARAFELDFVPVAKEPYDLVLDRARRRPAARAAVGAAGVERVRGEGDRARRLRHDRDGRPHPVQRSRGFRPQCGRPANDGERAQRAELDVGSPRARRRGPAGPRPPAPLGGAVAAARRPDVDLHEPGCRGGRRLGERHAGAGIAAHGRRGHPRDLGAELRHLGGALGDRERGGARLLERGRQPARPDGVVLGQAPRLEYRRVGGQLLLRERQRALAQCAQALGQPAVEDGVRSPQLDRRRHLHERRAQRAGAGAGRAAAGRRGGLRHAAQQRLERLSGEALHRSRC